MIKEITQKNLGNIEMRKEEITSHQSENYWHCIHPYTIFLDVWIQICFGFWLKWYHILQILLIIFYFIYH